MADRARHRSPLALAWTFARETVSGFSEDRAEMLAAALAFYTMLSLAPLVIIAVAIAGSLLGEGEARLEVSRLITQATGPNIAQTIDGWVDQAARARGVASVVGAALLLLAASRLFENLKGALNQVFDVDEYVSAGFKASVSSYVKRRLFAFALVLAGGALLIVVVVSRTALDAASSKLFAGTPEAATIAGIVQIAFSLLLVAAIAAVLFKIVPDTKVGWRAAAAGGVVTSILFNIGNVLVGIYLAHATVAVTYGAAGSLVVVLLCFFYSEQFVLVGA
jgi:membrane protein